MVIPNNFNPFFHVQVSRHLARLLADPSQLPRPELEKRKPRWQAPWVLWFLRFLYGFYGLKNMDFRWFYGQSGDCSFFEWIHFFC
jgi:hypothetical protein